MKTNLPLVSPLLGLAILLLSLPGAPGPDTIETDRTAMDPLGPRATQLAIAARLAELAPDDAEARELRIQLDKVRRKAHQSQRQTLEKKLRHGAPPGHPYAENPGAFHDALAELKTTIDGRRYPHNYKLTALQRARDERREAGKMSAPIPWVERGPGNVAGRSRAIVVDPDDATHNTWFVATVGGGIWKTTNGGNSWVHKTPQLSTLSTTCLAICSGQPDVMYAGTGMGYGRIVDLEGSGIWKSIDRGENWTQLASTANGELFAAINRIVVDPNDPDILVVCSNDTYSHLGTKGGVRKSGIFKSIDGGASFTKVYDSDASHPGRDARVQQIVASPSNFNALYATVNEVGVIRSVNAGDSWTVSADDFALPGDIGTGGGSGLSGVSVRTEMAISPSSPSILYAAVERPSGVADIYLSINSGSSWTLLTDTSGDPNWFNAFGVSGSQGYTAGWFDNTIAVDPFNPTVVFVGGVNLYRVQVNLGNNTRTTTPIAWWTFNNQGLPYSHADHHWLEIIPIDPGQQRYWVLDANDGGLAVSRDQGQNWTQYTGLGTTQFYGADKRPGVDAYFGGMQDNGTWHSGANANASSPWTSDLGGDGFEVAWNALRSQEMLGGSQYGNLSRSTDFGNTWNPIGDIGLGNAPFITKIANSKTDPDLVFSIGTGGVARSDNFGASWTRTTISTHWVGWRPFANVEVHDADPQEVWITSRISRDPVSGRYGGVHLSHDGGLSFEDLTNRLPAWASESSGLGMHPTDPATAYLLFSAPSTPKILRTVDYGQNWVDISGFDVPVKAPGTSSRGFPDVATFALLPMPYDPDILWAGTEVGLFISEDAGASWSYSDNGFPPVAIFELSVVDDEVIAATQGRGIWSVQLPELAGYTPPVVTLSPRLHQLAQSPAGSVDLRVDLRSPYDQTQILVNGTPFTTIEANASPRTELVPYPVTQDETLTVWVISTKDGREYRTPLQSVTVRTATPRNRYANDFNTLGSGADFTGNFAVTTPVGFQDGATHSQHPYPANQQLLWMLKDPIRVDELDSSIRYRDIAIVEEGNGTDYTDPNFWDYVIVEATRDGITWLPLIAGYDARANPAWLNAYRSGGSGTSAMYVQHDLDFKPSFVAGELVFLRFRLFSDPSVTGWGWAMDNLEIQTTAVGLPEEENQPEDGTPLPARVALMQNYPNPFNPSTTIAYELPDEERVQLVVYDLAGRRVRELVNETAHPAGNFAAKWNGRDENGRSVAAGTYFYRLAVGNKLQSRKMTLLK